MVLTGTAVQVVVHVGPHSFVVPEMFREYLTPSPLKQAEASVTALANYLSNA